MSEGALVTEVSGVRGSTGSRGIRCQREHYSTGTGALVAEVSGTS